MNEHGINLSEGEWRIMKLVWQSSPRTLGELTAELEPETGWNKSTVFIMLRRLCEKGALRLDGSKKPQLYYPLVSRAELTPRETESFLERVYDGSIGMLVSSLVGRRGLAREELDELRRIIDEAERNSK